MDLDPTGTPNVLKSGTAKAREALGHQYLSVTYVTINGAGGSARCWSFELVDWLRAHPGTLIVGLKEL